MVPTPVPPKYPIFLGATTTPVSIHYGIVNNSKINSENLSIYSSTAITTIPANAMTYWNITIANFNVTSSTGSYEFAMYDNSDRLLHYTMNNANGTFSFGDAQTYETTYIYFSATVIGGTMSGEGMFTITCNNYYTTS